MLQLPPLHRDILYASIRQNSIAKAFEFEYEGRGVML